MGSIKGMLYEKKLLADAASIKQLVLRNVTESDVKQEFMVAINTLFDTGHTEGRKLRKALAFQHNANESLKKQLQDADITPDEMYGRHEPEVAAR